ncbi:hypothetical protein GGS20DRAFT_554596 [Poronia punctata]|nr:hypothetical protein GGS20DRAFT_554596 [Poronia punctata]
MKSIKMRNPFKRKDAKVGDDTPEGVVVRNLGELFHPRRTVYDESAVYLHSIVEAAASPEAARICAEQLQSYLALNPSKEWHKEGTKEVEARFAWRYYVITLLGILANNPGRTFTRHLGTDFTKTVQNFMENRVPYSHELDGMLMQKLDDFEEQNKDPTNDRYDEGLAPLVEMWKKQKEGSNPRVIEYLKRKRRGPSSAPPDAMRGPKLPSPTELAGRLEEGRNSAKVLHDIITDTPPGRLLEDELVKEFVDRCQRASRSVQGYMDCRDPAPDTETMETLIDTNEQLQNALNLHRRAMLSARKNMDMMTPLGRNLTDSDERGSRDNEIQPPRRTSPPSAGLGVQPSAGSGLGSGSGPNESSLQGPNGKGKGKGREYEPLTYAGSSAGPSRSHTPLDEGNPFQDPNDATGAWEAGGTSDRYHNQEPRLAYEPYHPGFDSTPSYTGRQESAIGRESMHGAVGNSLPEKATGERPPRHDEVSDDDDDESELYDRPSQKQKEPAYRY